jgi:3-hydroxybutyryl-CoA dehydrogenase
MTSSGGAEPFADPFVIRTVAVIGAGRVGRSFALACAAAGYSVVLEDVMPANLRRAQEEYAELGPASSATAGPGNRAAPGQLRVALTIEDAVRDADLAVDFVPDELESKLEIFCLVDRMAPPKTVLLTPSDALSITDLASCTYRGDRCFAVRGMVGGDAFQQGMPVRLLHPKTAADELLKSLSAFLEVLGHTPRVDLDPDPPALMKNYL